MKTKDKNQISDWLEIKDTVMLARKGNITYLIKNKIAYGHYAWKTELAAKEFCEGFDKHSKET